MTRVAVDDLLSAGRVAERGCVTYRQLDYWLRIGLVEAAPSPTPGSGVHRRFHPREVRVVRAIGHLMHVVRLSRTDMGAVAAAVRDAAWDPAWLVIHCDGVDVVGTPAEAVQIGRESGQHYQTLLV